MCVKTVERLVMVTGTQDSEELTVEWLPEAGVTAREQLSNVFQPDYSAKLRYDRNCVLAQAHTQRKRSQ